MSSYNLARMLSSAKYRYQDQTRQAVNNVINLYRNLTPTLEKVHISPGNKRELIVLKGTIPVIYRQNTYNIPVKLAIPHDYPYNAPICSVNPTDDMTIKVSKHVDQTGKIFLPYLADWNAEHSDLLGVIQVMIITFGDMPPVYSKPKNPPARPPPMASMPTSMPMPFSSNSFSNPSIPPPYPTTYASNVYPAVNPIGVGNPSMPAYPKPTETPPSYPSAYSSYQTRGGPGSSDTITSEHIRISMLTAVEDRLKNRSREIMQQYKAEIDVLKRTGEDLNKGRITLDNIVRDIEMNLVEVDKCKDKINAKIVKLNEFLNKADQSKEQINIDEYFGPVQPLYKQLFNAFVEENAIVDTIYYLNEALKKEVIDLDVFLKHVREMSRRQFTMRALVKLCREKAGLPT